MSFFTDVAFPWVVGEEGGFTNDPRDPGNWTGGKVGSGALKGTKFGISAAEFPLLDIENLALGQAQGIAKSKYWDAFGGDQFPPFVALCVFDFGYNAGDYEAVKVLQRALAVEVDGHVGPQTLAAANTIDRTSFCENYRTARIAAYGLMAEWDVEGRGWTARANATAAKALTV